MTSPDVKPARRESERAQSADEHWIANPMRPSDTAPVVDFTGHVQEMCWSRTGCGLLWGLRLSRLEDRKNKGPPLRHAIKSLILNRPQNQLSSSIRKIEQICMTSNLDARQDPPGHTLMRRGSWTSSAAGRKRTGRRLRNTFDMPVGSRPHR